MKSILSMFLLIVSFSSYADDVSNALEELQGEWIGEPLCYGHPHDREGIVGGKKKKITVLEYEKSRQIFKGNEVRIIVEDFKDKECLQKTDSRKFVNSFVLGKILESRDNAREIDLTPQKGGGMNHQIYKVEKGKKGLHLYIGSKASGADEDGRPVKLNRTRFWIRIRY